MARSICGGDIVCHKFPAFLDPWPQRHETRNLLLHQMVRMKDSRSAMRCGRFMWERLKAISAVGPIAALTLAPEVGNVQAFFFDEEGYRLLWGVGQKSSLGTIGACLSGRRNHHARVPVSRSGYPG